MKNILAILIIFLPFLSTAQNWIWARESSSSTINRATSSIVDAAGNVYMVGTFFSPSITFGSSTLTKIGGSRQRDIFIAKYTPDGSVIWAKNFGNGGSNQGAALPLITIDNSGNLYLAGAFDTTSITFGTTTLYNIGFRGQMYLVKLDTAGNVIWANGVGGSGYMDVNAVKTDNAGNIYITGSSIGSGSNTFGAFTIPHHAFNHKHQLYVAKYRGDGNVLWAKTSHVGDSSSQARSITIGKNGNFLLTGHFAGPSIIFGADTLTNTLNGTDDVFVAEYDSLGNALWAKKYGSTGDDWGFATNTDSAGNFYLYGDVVDGAMTLGGITLPPGCCHSMFLARCDSAGNVLWAQKKPIYVTPGPAFSDAAGNLYLGGEFNAVDSIDFGGFKAANGIWNIFFVKYNALGTVQWATGVDSVGVGVRSVLTISPNADGDIYAAGRFTNPHISFGPSALTNDSTYENLWLAKLSSMALYAPHFIHGPSDSLAMCQNSSAVSINARLAVMDSNLSTPVTFSVLSGPGHGTLSASYATTSTSGILVPSGLTYTPATGYSGMDTFRVRVTDVTASDSITIYVSIEPFPVIAAIAGADSVCIGATITLTDATPGGHWNSSVPTNATINTAGVVSGMSAGTTVITYWLPSLCAASFVMDTITVISLPAAGTLTGADSICAGASTTLTASVAGGTWGIYNTCATISGGLVTGMLPGIDTISYMVSGTCGSSIAVKSMTINTTPVIDPILGIVAVLEGSTISLSDLTPGGVWFSTDTTIATVDSVGNASGIMAGTCTMGYIVTNTCGPDTVTASLTVSPLPMKPATTTEVVNYPNPSKGHVTLKIIAPYDEAANVKVMNMAGGVENDLQTETNKDTNISMGSSGVFFLRISSNHVSKVIKVIVEK